MKKIFTIILVVLGMLYWVLRVYVCLEFSMEKEFLLVPLNLSIELIILFASIICFIGILRRNVIASMAYFGMYASYFGTFLYERFIVLNPEIDIFTKLTSFEAIVVMIGVIVPFFVLIDQLIELNGSKLEDGTTTWFYKDEKFNRNIDKRADRNQYKIK